jgi:hypothetical protein
MYLLTKTTTLQSLRPNASLQAAVIGSPSLTAGRSAYYKVLQLNANGKFLRVSANADTTAIANSNSFTFLARIKLSATPGNTTRFVVIWGNSNLSMSVTSLDKLSLRVGTLTTPTGDALATSTASIAEGLWVWVAGVYNPVDKPLGIRLYTGFDVLAELALSTDNLLAATRASAFSATELDFGDRQLADRAVLADAEVMAAIPRGLTLAELNSLIKLFPV